MPPTGVLMSTCWSLPLGSFLTLTLHPATNARSAVTSRAVVKSRRVELIRRMCSSVFFPGALDAGAALRDIRNRDRQMPTNRNLSEQRFHGRDLGNRRG